MNRMIRLLSGLMFLSTLIPSQSILERTYTFRTSIDAFSVGLPGNVSTTLSLSIQTEGRWTHVDTLALEDEQDPQLSESNLVIFPKPIQKIRISGRSSGLTPHPIRISQEPMKYSIAATIPQSPPRILSRSEWGADESLLFSIPEAYRIQKEEGKAHIESEPSERVRDCRRLQRAYPKEFQRSHTIRNSAKGERYRWPLEYSKDINLLVIHHTAQNGAADDRPAVERIRALYAYHSINRGWGDMGYNFLIDESGQIYEGRKGGDYVIGGHAYCYNTGSISVALLGNFELTEPTMEQIYSLQWLLGDLVEQYDIDLATTTQFRGKTFPAIVGHKALNRTICPGFFLSGVISQVIGNVKRGKITARVVFPSVPRISLSRVEKRKRGRITENKTETTYRRKKMRTHTTRVTNQGDPIIRIRLTYENRGATVAFNSPISIGGTTIARGEVLLSHGGSSCIGSYNNRVLHTGIIRIQPKEALFTLTSTTTPRPYRGILECRIVDGKFTLINELPLEHYLWGLSEEPDTEPYEKQRSFAIAARSYAAHYVNPQNRKFPGKPFDGSDSPAEFQAYKGLSFEEKNLSWVRSVRDTKGKVIKKNGSVVKTPYFSSDDGHTRSPEERGWHGFPFAEVFQRKDDPWCEGMENRGHGVGMSGCGAEGQAIEGKTAEEILQYYFPGTSIDPL